jgi:hypothetical protein
MLKLTTKEKQLIDWLVDEWEFDFIEKETIDFEGECPYSYKSIAKALNSLKEKGIILDYVVINKWDDVTSLYVNIDTMKTIFAYNGIVFTELKDPLGNILEVPEFTVEVVE